MAITKILKMKSHPNKGIDYICNPKKTDDELFIYCDKCSYMTSSFDFEVYKHRYNKSTKKEYNEGTKAYHLIQSFKPNETTPEVAHRIGKEYADEILKGQYAYVIATHIDKGHIHNHIIFSAYNIDGTGKYNDNTKERYRRMEINDKICKANGLSVIKSKGRGKKYNEWSASKNKGSWKDKIKETIDKNILHSNSYEDFIKRMEEDSIIVNDKNKHITFKPSNKERPVRGKTLGEDYSADKIKERINNQTEKTNSSKEKVDKQTKDDTNEFTYFDLHNKIIDTSKDKFKNSVGLNRWAKKKNLQSADELFNIMRQQGFSSIDNLREYIIEQEIKTEDYNEIIEYNQQAIIECQDNINYIKNYQEFKKFTYGLNQAKDKNAFQEKYGNQLNLYYTAERKLMEAGINDFNDETIFNLKAEIKNLTAQQTEAKKQIKADVDKDLPELKELLNQFDTYLGHNTANRKQKNNSWEL